MKIFIFLCYVAVTLANQNALKCIKNCPPEDWEPSCSYDKRCYYEAESDCILEMEICLRKAYNAPRFVRKRDGYCIRKHYPKTSSPCIPMDPTIQLPNDIGHMNIYNDRLFATTGGDDEDRW